MSQEPENLPGMIGRHPLMLGVYRLVRRYGPGALPVAIVGETGTGKELVARAIHRLGTPGGPFLDINCAALPDGLAEGELFGWERGAFTGAVGGRVGLVEAAHGGTLFLDEACSLTPAIQAKLLRVIERHEVRRLGARENRRSVFRLVVAVSEPLEALRQAGRLRADFIFRVSTVEIGLPPLRARTADLPLLAEHFLAAANTNGHADRRLSAGARALLERHDWPGNVRELRSLMERLEVECHGNEVTASDVAALLRPVKRGMELAEALEANHWDVSRTARALGLARSTVYQHIARLGLSRPSAANPRGKAPRDFLEDRIA